jgi:hypothetical protein
MARATGSSTPSRAASPKPASPPIYSVHVRTRKFRNLAKTKRYVVPAPRANSKTQGGTRIDSDSICHRHHSVFRVFKRFEYTCRPAGDRRSAPAGRGERTRRRTAARRSGRRAAYPVRAPGWRRRRPGRRGRGSPRCGPDRRAVGQHEVAEDAGRHHQSRPLPCLAGENLAVGHVLSPAPPSSCRAARSDFSLR